MHQGLNKLGFRWVMGITAFLISGCLALISSLTLAAERDKVAVLPFRIHALQPLDHLKKGLQGMIATRMTKQGFQVINPDIVNMHPKSSLPLSDIEDINTLGRDLNVRWVVAGSLTQVGEKISLDVKVVDVTRVKSPFSIFLVEDHMDRLADATDKVAANIFDQIAGILPIDSILVEGNKRIESAAILAVVRSKKGDRPEPEKLDQDLRAVYKMGYFTDVRIRTEEGPKGITVVFNVSEKPSITKIAYKGNKKIDNDDLEKETGIKLYSILDRSAIRQSVNRLKELYRQKGYFNVEIEEKIEELPKNEVALIYEINEGEKVYITHIEFVGNTKFDDDDLKDLMETSEKGLLSWITDAGLLDRKKLEFDLHKITSFYHNHGYIDAKAGEPEITYQKGEGMTVTIEINEGEPYKVNTVKVEGDLILPAEELLKKTKIPQEEFMNREVIREDTIRLQETYADEGYAYADVSPLINKDDEKHLVDIAFKISKGTRVRFERINVVGNTSTRDKVIRRELKVYEGDYFSGKGIKASTKNLHRLDFFDNVEVKTRKGSSEDLMVMDIDVKEKQTGSFMVGAGYSSFDNVVATFEIAENNFLGYGQRLSLRGKLGGRTTEVDLRFTEPWLLDKPIAAGIDLYKWEREYDEYTKDSLGGGVRFGFPIGIDEDFTRGSASYFYDDADISDIDEFAATVIREMEGRNVTSSIVLGVNRNTKDRSWNPSEGSFNTLTYEYAGGFLGGDVGFDKYLATTAWYFPLPFNTVFMAQGRWGYINQHSGEKLPIYQKFLIGGLNTVRGFDDYDISPRDPDTGDKIGGEKMMIYNLEYRFPVLKEHGVTGLVFFDAGNVFEKDDSYTFSDIRRSAGTGIRWYSPFGPLRLEYGRNLDPLEDESSGKIEFGVGGLF